MLTEIETEEHRKEEGDFFKPHLPIAYLRPGNNAG